MSKKKYKNYIKSLTRSFPPCALAAFALDDEDDEEEEEEEDEEKVNLV